MPVKIFTGLMLLISVPFLMNAQSKQTIDLSDYQWKNRLLLIFSPAKNNDHYVSQLQELEGKEAGLKDRDMKIFHFINSGKSFVGDEAITESDKATILKKCDVKSDAFAIILIGKDGTEKLRKQRMLNTGELFSVIDAMPMRQREMKQNR